MASNSKNTGKPTKPEILKWMKDLNDWFSVGEKVGVRFSKLTGLEDKYPQDAVKAREEMVDLWLEKDQNPTWARLADGFDHAGQRALARRMRETYNCPRKPQPERKLLVVGKPGPQTNKLAPNKKPTPPAFPDTNYPKPPRSPPSSPPPYRMPRLAFDCTCGRFTPVVVRIAISEARKQPKLLPYYTATVSHEVQLQLKHESEEMVGRVGSFMNRLILSLKSRSISPAALAKCILDIDAYAPTREIQAPLLEHRSREIKAMTSIDDMILTLSDYVSFFNHSVLDHLVGELGTDEDREELETFKFYCGVFSKRSVYQTPSYTYGYMRLRTECMVVMRADEKWAPKNGVSIQELSNLMVKICDIIQLLPHTFHFCQVDLDPGGKFGGGRALEIVFRVPPHVVHEVFPLSSEEEKAVKSLGVNHFHTIHYCFPPRAHSRANEPEAHYSHVVPGRKPTGRKSGNQKVEEALLSGLKPCCGYHQHMEQERSQSCALVTGVDTGYEGDSDDSSEETAPLEPLSVAALRPNYQKRLMWRLANSHF